jgi:phosphoribosylpyrophosphate synthetase
MGPAFDSSQRTKAIKNAHAVLSQIDLRGCTLVGTGLSGALLLCLIADKCGCACTIVRKKESQTHSKLTVEGEVDFDRFIILDDLIDSGNTVGQIQESLRSINPNATLEGIILYNDSFDYLHESWEEKLDCWVRSI